MATYNGIYKIITTKVNFYTLVIQVIYYSKK